MKKLAIILLGLGLCALLFPQQAFTSKKIPSVMYQFLNRVVNLSPYIYDKDTFVASKNDKEIAKNLQEMKELSSELAHHKRLTAPGYEKSADYFIQNINRAHTFFTKGHKQYAYRLVRSTLHACSSCHTQESSHRSMSWDFSTFNLPKKALDKANFYYTVRGYKQAWRLFAEVITSYGKKHTSNNAINEALDKLLTIALRIDRDPTKLRIWLAGLSNHKHLPVYFQTQNKVWISELLKLEKEKGYRFLDKSAVDFEAYINRQYRSVYPFAGKDRSQQVVMEYVTGMMFEFINKRPQDKTQGMLYWLGVSNFVLDQFESSLLGESFLRECIENYPPTVISYTCFSALEDEWVMGFSGSSGIHLPQDLIKELESYRKKLNMDQPWSN